jgi:electron transfer flavoprotein beta subunit
MADIVFCGKESTDFQCRLVPALIAGMLGMAMVSAVSMLELMDGSLSAESEIEGGRERLRAFLPAVVTTEKGLNIPSKTGIKAVLAAKRAVIDEMEVSQREPAMVRFAAYESPERKKQCRFYQDTKELAALLNAERAPGV